MTSCPYQACMYGYHQACMTSCPYQACTTGAMRLLIMSSCPYRAVYIRPRFPPGTWPNPRTSVCVLTTDHPSAIHVPSNHQVSSTYLVTTNRLTYLPTYLPTL
jgi:hypothetical protein